MVGLNTTASTRSVQVRIFIYVLSNSQVDFITQPPSGRTVFQNYTLAVNSSGGQPQVQTQGKLQSSPRLHKL